VSQAIAIVLVLDASYRPLTVIPWQHAITMVLDERARMVVQYADRVIRSPSITVPWPAVVALYQHVGRPRRVRFNRMNVLARDGYQCAYCGLRPTRNGRPDLAELTLDHVVPRAQSRNHRVLLASGRNVPVTCWENVVTCCVPCNGRKADRTPVQARMSLRVAPRVPTSFDSLRMSLGRVRVPEEWKDFLPAAAVGWRDYWTVDLDLD
jgi:5-methylcytosine-specific restriction endonuclease McrA